MTKPNGGKAHRNIWQMIRFAMVGGINTAIDFAVTNALVLLLRPQGSLALMAISLTACGIATLNSFFLNRGWTFRDPARQAGRGTMGRFLAVSAVSMAVNTSVFLFVAKYLPDRVAVNPFLAINIAKAAGVAAAFSVAFLGMRFGVFGTEAVRVFRESFRFSRESTLPVWRQVAVVAALALVVRVAYLFFTTAVYGDAVNYSWVAQSLARGQGPSADPFWSSLFCFWEALFLRFGVPPVAGAIVASLVPGVLLVVPATLLARHAFGPRAAWLAGLFCAVHPRLVEYSGNGYAESFFLLAFTTGALFLAKMNGPRPLACALGWGFAFGVFAGVRTEALVAFAATVPLAFLALRPPKGPPAGERPRAPRLPLTLAAGIAAFLATAVAYAFLSSAALGTSTLFQKTSNLQKNFSEQLDMKEAARETYGTEGTLYGGRPAPRKSLADILLTLARRYPANFMYTLERLPGVILTPLPLFAVLFPLFVRRGAPRGALAPLLLMLLFPLAFYPLIQLEPRLLFPVLVPVAVFGAAGLEAFVAYVDRAKAWRWLLPGAAAALVIFSGALAALRGLDVERQYRVHRELATWLSGHGAAGQPLAGCGYGNVSTTGFLVGSPGVPRVVGAGPEGLVRFVDGKGLSWLILYESFVKTADPGLLPFLDQGLPGFAKEFEARDAHGLRACIYRRAPAAPPAP